MNRISWIAAEADAGGKARPAPRVSPMGSNHARDRSSPLKKFSTQHFPRHQFPQPGDRIENITAEDAAATTAPVEDRSVDEQEVFADDPLDRNPELRAYRRHTVALLRRYMRFSMETGRLPSVLGTAFFRSGVTTYSVVTFEDRVVFAHDVELCLERMEEFSRSLIARHILQEHNCWDTARLLHCNEKTIRRMVPLVLDQLSEIMLEVGVLETLDSVPKKTCQGGQEDEFSVSDCEEGKNNF